jgi:hypothetical protein
LIKRSEGSNPSRSAIIPARKEGEMAKKSVPAKKDKIEKKFPDTKIPPKKRSDSGSGSPASKSYGL